jgi:photosystem II stability/assembly factor-like uncharacterized protein
MPSKVVLVVGTKKGLFLLTSDEKREDWALKGPFHTGNDINHATIDPRNGELLVTANNPWFGNRIERSNDLGETWAEGAAGPKYAEDDGRSVERLWRIEPGRASEPGALYCGADPGCLFRSDDAGLTWTENDALGHHSTRNNWFPGAGGLIVHSIILDPQDSKRMWVAISAAGVFRSEDGGASWTPSNDNLKNVGAKYDPNIPVYTEVGQCVHHLVHAGGTNERLYAQTHWGTYRSDDGAKSWVDITEGLPADFGMVMAAHPHNPDVAYVLPLQGAEFRVPPEGKLRVYRTANAGATWEPLTKGLPQEGAFMGTYREGMATDSLDRAGIYFGTNTGQVYASADEGDSWRLVTANLPPVSSVSAAVL